MLNKLHIAYGNTIMENPAPGDMLYDARDGKVYVFDNNKTLIPISVDLETEEEISDEAFEAIIKA